jgi:FdhD protein
MMQLSQSSLSATTAVAARDESGRNCEVMIAGEHPLCIYLDKREMVTLMTLGRAPELLCLGWLLNQRIIEQASDIASIQVDWDTGAAAVTSQHLAHSGKSWWDDPSRLARFEHRMDRKTVTTGCGQGTMYSDLMATVREERRARHGLPQVSITKSQLLRVIGQARHHQAVYQQAGGVHACALADNRPGAEGAFLYFIEDVGRHNAVDAITGWMQLETQSAHDKIFYTTGRLTSEMVIKCAQMGILILVSRSGITAMGFELAQELGICLIGRCQGKHFLVYTHPERVDFEG